MARSGGGEERLQCVPGCPSFSHTPPTASLPALSRALPHRHLTYAVCFGVGLGMASGAAKILFQVPIVWIILAKYAVAVALSLNASEEMVNIAWDSAGELPRWPRKQVALATT